MIDGYSDVRDGGTFPIALPALSAEYRVLGVHLIFIPHRAPERAGTAVQAARVVDAWG